jgi:RNA recognition motif-containing protein
MLIINTTGRRLYIGNLAYATTEGELKDFFKEYLV